MRHMFICCIMLASACSENTPAEQSVSQPSYPTTATSTPIPKYDDLPPLVSDENYQMYELSELGLNANSTYNDAMWALDTRFRKGAMIMGNRVPYQSSTIRDDQLIASYVVKDADDPTYYLRQIVVGFHMLDDDKDSLQPFAVGVRHVCRDVKPLVWTTQPCQ